MANLEFRLMLAHHVDFYTDDPNRFIRQTVEPAVPVNQVPRARAKHSLEGIIDHNGTSDGTRIKVPFYHVNLGLPESLPRPERNVMLGVSALTIQSVYAMNDRVSPESRRPTDDLLCLYDEVWQSGERLGARGLSRPVPVRRKPVDVVLPTGVIEANVRNACPYGVALYAPNAPNTVGPDHPVLHALPGAEQPMMAEHEEELLPDLSEQLGIPVYQTSAVGAQNLGPDRMNPGELWIASPNVPLAAGAAALEAGVIVQAYTVRSERSQHEGVVVGGRGYGMLDASVINSYAI